jgi:hypothetical protein
MRIKSKNGINLYQGTLFNWSIESVYHTQTLPEVYMIWLNDVDGHSIHFYYHPDSNIFQINEHKFLIPDIYEAEKIIKVFIAANDSDVPSLFKHINDVRKEKIDEIFS